MTYHDSLKPIWKGSKSMVDYCNYQSDYICPPITIAPRHPTQAFPFIPNLAALIIGRSLSSENTVFDSINSFLVTILGA